MIKSLPDNKDEVENTAKDILNSIAERDIYTGDGIEFCIIDSKGGVTFKRDLLRRD